MQNKKAKTPWREIASDLNKQHGNEYPRNGKQCRERWNNHLDPDVNRGAWTHEEDMNLLRLFLMYEHKWSDLSKAIGNRTENAVKNRFTSLIKKYRKDESLPPQPSGAKEDLIWEKQIASIVLESQGFGPIFEIEAKREESSNSRTDGSPEDISPSALSELGIKKAQSDTFITEGLNRKKSARANKPHVDQMKNLLKTIVREEPHSEFKPTMTSQNQSSMQPSMGTSFLPHIYEHEEEMSRIPQQHMSFPNQPAPLISTIQQAVPSQRTTMQYMQSPRHPFSQPGRKVETFSTSYLPSGHVNPGNGMMTELPEQTLYTIHQNLPTNMSPMSFMNHQAHSRNNDASPNMHEHNRGDLAQNGYSGNMVNQEILPLGSKNILNNNNVSLHINSPSILSATNNPFLAAPTLPIDSMLFHNHNRSSDDSRKDEVSNLTQQMNSSLMMEERQGTPASHRRDIKREFVERSFVEFNP